MADQGYVGDQATILPSQNEALIHFADQFAQMEQQRQAQKAAMQRAEQERLGKAVKYIGDAFDPNKYKGASLAQRGINERLADAQKKFFQLIKDHPEISDVVLAQGTNEAAKEIKSYADLSDQIQGSITAATTKHIDDPGIDSGTATDLMLHDALFTTDENGNKVLNPNPTAKSADEYYADLLKNHKDKIIAPGDPFLRKVLIDPHTQEDNEPDVYDAKGNKIKSGGTAKVPYYGEKNYDDKGNLIGVKTRTTPYMINGKVVTEPVMQNGKPVLDKNGNPVTKPVMVVPDEMYQTFMSKPSSISASVGLEFERKYPKVDPESPMADMLKRKIFTDKVNAYGDWSYKPNKDESAERKEKIIDNARQNKSLRLQELGYAESVRMHNHTISEDKKKDVNAQSVNDLVGEYVKNSATTMPDIASPLDPTQVFKILPVKKISVLDQKYFTGEDKNGFPLAQPYESGGEKYWIIRPDGNLEGDGGQEINKNSVNEAFVNDRKTETIKILDVGARGIKTDIEEPKKNRFGNIKNIFVPKKTKKADKPIILKGNVR